MFLTRSFSITLFVLTVIMSSAFAAEQSPTASSAYKSEVWAPVDESDWAVFMDAPAYHFDLAKEYLQKGEAEKASSELNLGNTFLTYQRDRIAFAAKQIAELSKAMAAGKEKDLRKLDSITTAALNIISYKFAMVPLEIEPTPVFENAYKYHFEKAKLKLQENDRAGAASETRKAGSFLRLWAAQFHHVAKADLDAAVNDLKDLASKIESGTVKDIKELERVFQKAMSVVSKKKK